MKNELGFSITELMISLFLSSLILLSLNQLYFRSKAQYLQMHELISTQLDLQWIKTLLAHSIKQAGFTPCNTIDHLQVYGTPIAGLIIKTQPQSMIQVNRMHELFNEVESIISPSELLLENSNTINADRPILIADCMHAEINAIVSYKKSNLGIKINLAKPLHFSYSLPLFVGEWIQEQWFVKTKGKKSALYYRMHQIEELSPLIHSMNIEKRKKNNQMLLNVILGLDEKTFYTMEFEAGHA